jgi:hypothetical protein
MARVEVASSPLWRIRLARGLPRYCFYALALWGVLASVRYAVAPPNPPRAVPPPVREPDPGAEAFATLFARRYLSWSAAQPQAYDESLVPFLGGGEGEGEGMSEGAGVALPARGAQEVQWVQVAQERAGPAGERVYTLACQTAPAGLVYLSVSVMRTPSGALALAGYPALVGPPASAAARDPAEAFPDVSQPALQTVVERALRNYLAGDSSELAADLAAGAQVSLPSPPLALRGLQRLKWIPGGGSVLALVQAADGRGVRYTLQYELDVEQAGGRWEVSAIQMNPDANT